jgi:peroxiredoxin family protein
VSKRLCILAKGDTYEQIHTMVGLVGTAATMGWEAHVFLTYGVLFRHVRGTLSEAEVGISTDEVAVAYRKGIDNGKIPDLDELLAEARAFGGERVKLYGCTTSIKLLHLEPKLPEQVDSLLGHASFLQLASVEGAQLVVT